MYLLPKHDSKLVTKELFDIDIIERIQKEGYELKEEFFIEMNDDKIDIKEEEIKISELSISKPLIEKLSSKGWFMMNLSKTKIQFNPENVVLVNDIFEKFNMYIMYDYINYMNTIGNISLSKLIKMNGDKNEKMYKFLISNLLLQITDVISDYEKIKVSRITDDDDEFYKINDVYFNYHACSTFMNVSNIRAFRAIINYCIENERSLFSFKKFLSYMMKTLINGITEMVNIITNEEYVVENEQEIPFYDYRFILVDKEELGYVGLLSDLNMDYTSDYHSGYLDYKTTVLNPIHTFGKTPRLLDYYLEDKINNKKDTKIELFDIIKLSMKSINQFIEEDSNDSIFINKSFYVDFKDVDLKDIPSSDIDLSFQKQLTLYKTDYFMDSEDQICSGENFLKLIFIGDTKKHYASHEFLMKILFSRMFIHFSKYNPLSVEDKTKYVKSFISSANYIFTSLKSLKVKSCLETIKNYLLRQGIKDFENHKDDLSNYYRIFKIVLSSVIRKIGLTDLTFSHRFGGRYFYFKELYMFDLNLLNIKKDINNLLYFMETKSNYNHFFNHVSLTTTLNSQVYDYIHSGLHSTNTIFKNQSILAGINISNVISMDILFNTGLSKDLLEFIHCKNNGSMYETKIPMLVELLYIKSLGLSPSIYGSDSGYVNVNKLINLLSYRIKNWTIGRVNHVLGRRNSNIDDYQVVINHDVGAFLEPLFKNDSSFIKNLHKYFNVNENIFESIIYENDLKAKRFLNKKEMEWNTSVLSKYLSLEFVEMILKYESKFKSIKDLEFLGVMLDSKIFEIEIKRNSIFSGILTKFISNKLLSNSLTYASNRNNTNMDNFSNYFKQRLGNKNYPNILNELSVIVLLSKFSNLDSIMSGVQSGGFTIYNQSLNYHDTNTIKNLSINFIDLIILNSSNIYNFYVQNREFFDKVFIKMSRNNHFKSSNSFFYRIIATILYNNFNKDVIMEIVSNLTSNEEIQFKIAISNTFSNIINFDLTHHMGINNNLSRIDTDLMFNLIYGVDFGQMYFTQLLINACKGKISDVLRYLSINSHQNLHNIASFTFTNYIPDSKTNKILNKALELIIKNDMSIQYIEEILKIQSIEYKLLENISYDTSENLVKSIKDVNDTLTFKKLCNVIKINSMDELLPKRLDLPQDYISDNTGLKVHFHKHNDLTVVNLGEITNCCQTIGGMAQSSVIEGIINPYSGFISIQKDNKIIAQSWIWLALDKKTLILDSIETKFTDEVKDITQTISEWGYNIPYDLVIGSQYTKVDTNILNENNFKLIKNNDFNTMQSFYDYHDNSLKYRDLTPKGKVELEISNISSKYLLEDLDNVDFEKIINVQFDNLVKSEKEINEIRDYYKLPKYPKEEFTLELSKAGAWTFNSLNSAYPTLFKMIPISISDMNTLHNNNNFIEQNLAEKLEKGYNNPNIYSDAKQSIYYLKK